MESNTSFQEFSPHPTDCIFNTGQKSKPISEKLLSVSLMTNKIKTSKIIKNSSHTDVLSNFDMCD